MEIQSKIINNINFKDSKTNSSNNYIPNKVAIVTIIWNFILATFKFIAGIIGNSSAMISDAIHSASDIFSTIVVIIGIKLASKEPDKEHPYGHERLECIAAIILSMILFVTGLEIGISAIKSLLSGNTTSNEIGVIALIAAIASIIVKEAMYWYTRHYAKKLKSGALMADAWHHRSDSLSSIGALIGIIGTRQGLVWADSVASIVIFLFIAKASWDIFIDAIDKLIDKACDEETERKMRKFVVRHKDVLGIDLFQTRQFGNKIYVDIEIVVDGEYSLNQAHAIAEEIHDTIEQEFDNVKHVMIHVNSASKERLA